MIDVCYNGDNLRDCGEKLRARLDMCRIGVLGMFVARTLSRETIRL